MHLYLAKFSAAAIYAFLLAEQLLDFVFDGAQRFSC